MTAYRQAATCILLRSASSTCEVLLLRRNPALALHGGLWVFPGGGVTAGDRLPDATDPLASLRRAAVRETAEESGIDVPADALSPSARWFTPRQAPRQYDTRFFAVHPADHPPVRIDNGEICDFRWAAPQTALADHQQGVHRLPPPVFLTLLRLSGCPDADTAFKTLAAMAREEYRPRIVSAPHGDCILYAEDAGYAVSDPDVPGPRHRLWMIPGRWLYERTD